MPAEPPCFESHEFGIDPCLHINSIPVCPIRDDMQDRNAYVALGTNLCHSRNLTIINGSKMGNAPFLAELATLGARLKKSVYY